MLERRVFFEMNKLVRRVWVAALLVLFCSNFAEAQKLSAEEQRIVNYIDAHKDEAVGTLEKIVNIESPTENVAGVKQVGMVFKKEFEALGFKARWIDMPAEMKRAGHLVAETEGSTGKRLLLLGHIDTVLSGEKFRRQGNKAFGTGGADMKAGDIVMLYALKALHANGALKDRRIAVMLTGDEESAGRPLEISRRDMIALAKDRDAALSFEATVGNSATVGRRGSSNWILEVEARTGHSAGIFGQEAGSGAIFEASRIVHQFYLALSNEKYLTLNPSVIAGGTKAALNYPEGSATGKTNVIPAKVIVMGDLRFISEAQKEAARTKMRAITAQNLPGTSAKITFEDGYPAMTPTEANYELLKQMAQVSQDLGFGTVTALDPGARGAGDIAFISHLIPGLDGIGASGGGAHAPGEVVDLESLPAVTKKAAILIYRLTF